MKGCHICLILFWVALSACTSDVDEKLEVQLPIGFTATTDIDAREVASPTITNMSVYAYYTGSSSWEAYNKTSVTPNFMSNQKIAKSENSDTWTYSPIKYWPNTVNDKISFFAYTPFEETSKESGSKITFDNNGDPSFTCTLPSVIPTSEPNLFLASLTDQTKNAPNLTFNFKYALTKVSFKVENQTGADITVSSLQITAPQVGAFKFGGTNNGYTCVAEGNSLSTEFTTATLPSAAISTGATSGSLGTCYLLPDNTHVTCKLSYNASGEKTFSLGNTEKEWTSGGSITYNLILK